MPSLNSSAIKEAKVYLQWLHEHCGVRFSLLPEESDSQKSFEGPRMGQSFGAEELGETNADAIQDTAKDSEKQADFFDALDPWIFIGPRGQEPLAENPTLKKLIEALGARKAFVFECSEDELDGWLSPFSKSAALRANDASSVGSVTENQAVFPEQSRVVCFSQSFSRKIGSVWKGRLLALDHPVLMAQDIQSKRRAWALLKAWM